MKKIGFVIPWYSEKIPGGAEMALRGLTTHLHASGVELEIITTCVKDFNSDWSVNHFSEGVEIIHGFPVRRFKVRRRNRELFDQINEKLMNGCTLSEEEENDFLREMVNSPDMYAYMRDHKDEYSLFVFTPYMFGTTYYGAQVCPEKTVLIPCFHDESYLYMRPYKQVFEKVAANIYLASPEKALANRLFDLSGVKQAVYGTGVTELSADAERFRKKFGINSPFIIYAGRKDKGKMVHLLTQYFDEYTKRRDTALKLVLIGGGDMQLPEDAVKSGKIIDLGFVDIQDKYDAQAAATVLCQPSQFESFSLVIMESWLCSRPVMVNKKCAVTRAFASETNGGLYFDNYFEFEGCLDYLLAHPDIADQMGENGRKYVLENFSWDVIVKKYTEFFEDVAESAAQK